MIYHIVPRSEWQARPDHPYAPASLTDDGFVHCSPDEETSLAIVNAFYRTAPKPLLALVIDEDRLGVRVEWEKAAPVPPPGVAESVVFPHVYGPVDRDAVTRILEIAWDEQGRATGLADVS
ncbi:DUF952 domain-containing protein [Streptomyces sp. NPDC095613]|uniref:DUF952 domain-containing protein n=1 Tax=Streptomyces sp. NPDC095613 TaxID=3155540 RepID=UPI00331DFF92